MAILAICGVAIFSSSADAFAASSGVAMYGSATEAALPSDGTTYANGYLEGLDCVSAGNCTAVGSYQSDSSVGMTASTLTESSGTFAPPVALSLPANSLSVSENELNDVSCWSPGNCGAVGDYSTGGYSYVPLAALETSGTFGSGIEVGLPANAATGTGLSSIQFASLDGISCWAAEACAAVGSYETTDGNAAPMVVTMSGGTFAAATELDLPSDARGSADLPDLNSISCAASGDCVAVGSYVNSSLIAPLVEIETNGTWSASTISLPAGATTTDADSYLTSVSCVTSPSDCAVVGSFTDASGYSQAMAATEVGGSFASATEIPLPSGASSEPDLLGLGVNELDGVSCTSPGICTAVGSYEDSDGNFQTMVTGSTAGEFAPATEVALPTDAATGEQVQFASIGDVSCTSAISCLAVGQFSTSAGTSPPMLAAIDPLLSLTTTSLPTAVVGDPYAASLGASGGTGSYTYSVTSGSLPANLSLNPTTGAISGTPSVVPTEPITFQVTDPGPPSQKATAALSLAPVTVTSVTTTTTIGAGGTTSTTIAASGGSAAAAVPTPAPLPTLPKGVKASAYGTPTDATVASISTSTLLSEAFEKAKASLRVAKGALPVGTVVSIYPMTTHSSLSLPKGATFVASIAVSWKAPDGSTPAAGSPITLTITDQAIKTGDTIYLVTASGSLKTAGSATKDGEVTVTFEDDPVFVVAHATKAAASPTPAIAAAKSSAPTALSSSTSDAASTPTAAASTAGSTSSGSLAFTGASSTLIWLALSGALLVLTSSFARRRLRQRIDPRV